MNAVVEIRLPQFGMGMVDGTINTWFKREGDSVTVDEVVAEVEAAKTTEELIAPATGVLERILVPEGATVEVHTVLALILPVGAVASEVRSHEPDHPVKPVPPPPAWGPAPVSASVDMAPGRQITPRARRSATDLGVDLDSVVGTGPGGRVTEDDVRAAVRASEK